MDALFFVAVVIFHGAVLGRYCASWVSSELQPGSQNRKSTLPMTKKKQKNSVKVGNFEPPQRRWVRKKDGRSVA